MLGTYNATAIGAGLCQWHDIQGIVDASVVPPGIRRGWGGTAARTTPVGRRGDGLARTWTGIMGASADLLPLLGPVPGKDGLRAAVAFHGYGVARILTATRAVAYHLHTEEWASRQPRAFEITAARLARAQKAAKIPAFQGVAEAEAEQSRLETCIVF